MLWLNSLSSRFKSEILKKLISEKIELSLSNNYKVFVDFGHAGEND